MIDNGITQGNENWAKPVVITRDWVYIHSGIKKLSMVDEEQFVSAASREAAREEPSTYEYREIQYSKDEYIALLSEQLTNTQLALVELYERGI